MGLKEAIKNTIDYAAKFGGYINNREVEERLISNKKFSQSEILKTLEELGYKGKKNSWYKVKMNEALVLANKIKREFKDILFLGVSGSVASGHPKKNDDIDILIMTEANKLWKTRLHLRWWIFKNRVPHRKYGKKEKKDEFCFNFWLDETYLILPKNKQNLRSAVDLVLLKPLINKDYMYEKLLLTNNWAKKWVATPYENKIFNFQFSIFKKKQKQNKIDKFINCLYFWPQYWYMKKKISKEMVGLHQAFFHRQMVK